MHFDGFTCLIFLCTFHFFGYVHAPMYLHKGYYCFLFLQISCLIFKVLLESCKTFLVLVIVSWHDLLNGRSGSWTGFMTWFICVQHLSCLTQLEENDLIQWLCSFAIFHKKVHGLTDSNTQNI